MTPKALYFSFAVAAALLFAAPAAWAGEPIPGTSVGLDHDPGGDLVATGTTDSNGHVTFRDLKPGNYILTIDGRSLVAAIGKLASTPEPEKKSGGSFSLGIGGGMFGGGGSPRSSSGSGQGAGPVQGAPGGPQGGHGGSNSSGGGMGVGMSIPIGGGGHDSDNGDASSGDHLAKVEALDLRLEEMDPRNPTGGLSSAFAFEMPYCRDSAGQGMRIGFYVPPMTSANQSGSDGVEVVVDLGGVELPR